MRILALLALILALAGCHMLRPELPPWARPVPAKSEPAPEAPPEAEASVVPEPATTPAPPPEPAEPAPAPVTPPPPPRPPAVAPAPAGPPPPPVRAATLSRRLQPHAPAAPPADSPPLTASLPPAEARRLQEEAQRGIERDREAPPSTGEPAARAEGPGNTTAGAGARRAGQEGSRWTGVRARREPGGEGSNARGRSQHPPLNLLRRVTFYILPRTPPW